jgi:hypothetical protein
MADIQKGGLDDEGVGINAVERALMRVGIVLRDGKDSFRDFSDVLEDVAKKWDKLSEVEQANIAKAVAGVRQRETFLVLMNNYNKTANDTISVEKLLGIQAESNGLALDRYAIYLENVEAAQNRAKASWEQMWQTTISSNVIKEFYDITSGVFDLIDSLGGLIPVLQTAIAVLIIYKAEAIQSSLATSQFAKSLFLAGGNLKGFISLIKSGGLIGALTAAINPATALALALVSVVVAWQTYQTQVVDRVEEGARVVNAQVDSRIQKLKEEKATLEEVLETYKDVIEATKAGGDKAEFLIGGDLKEIRKDTFNDFVSLMAERATGYKEYRKAVAEAAKEIGYLSDEEGNLYKVGARGLRIYQEDLNALIESQYKFGHSFKDSRGNIQNQTKEIEELTLSYDGLLKTLEDLRSSTQLLEDLSKKEVLGIEDVQKVILAYENYEEILNVQNGVISLNEDALKRMNLQRIDEAIAAAKANDETEKSVAILEAYRNEIQKSIPMSRDFVDSFNNILLATSEGLSGDAKEKFDGLAESIYRTNEQFKTGQLDAIEYFNILEQQMASANFAEMFAQNEGAAQSFFTGMVTNATQALYQMTSEFDTGKIGLLEYMDRLKELSDVFSVIGDVIMTSGEQMGMTSEQISNISSSMDGLLGSVSELMGMYDLVNMSIAGMSENLEFNSQEYLNWAGMVSQAMASVGGDWYDAAGNALVGADAIFDYATAASGNMTVLVDQIAKRVNGIIQKATGSIANFLRGVAEGIRNFKGQINFTPKQTGTAQFQIGIPGVLELPFALPSFGLEIGADFSGAANFIDNMASGIEDWGASEPIDLSDFINPKGLNSGLKELKGGLGGVGGKVGDLTEKLKEATKGTKELTDALKEAKKSAIDSLKEQLSGYKKVIDARKKLLDSLHDEKKFKNEVREKNNEILKVQNELAALQFDNSEEAAARRRILEDQLAELQKELGEIRDDRKLEKKKEALDNEYKEFETYIENAIKAITAIQATSLEDFARQLAEILKNFKPNTIGVFHEGANKGMVGGRGSSNSKGEVFAKLLSDEVVVNSSQIDQFLSRTLPQLALGSTNNSSGIEINMPINIYGNADKNVLRELEKIPDMVVEKINNDMLKRGYNRRADAFST